MLGVVWGIKYFRCYLYGRKFTVLTDHAALKWSLSVKDPSSRLVRWQMLLSEFEYEVVHKPGKLHINADVLSRAVRFTQGRVMEELSRGKVLEEQGRDEYCKKISDNEEFRRDDEGLLFRVKEKKWQLVVPRTLIKRVKKLVHSDVFAGHSGVDRTIKRSEQMFYWRGMRRDLEKFVRECNVCERLRNPRRAPLCEPYQTTAPGQMIAMDIVGPLPRTARGNTHLLTFVDHFSRYAEAIPIGDTSAKTVAEKFVYEYIVRHGAPERVLTDQGSNFVSELFKGVCKMIGVEKVQTTAYRPSSNGRIERFHGTLIEHVRHYVNERGTNWDKFIPFALAAYRAAIHGATKHSPNYITFGRELTIPFDCDLGPRAEHVYVDDYVMEMRKNLDEASQWVKRKSQKAEEYIRQRTNRGRHLRELNSGEWIYIKEPVVPTGRCKKFYVPWKGPYLVIERKGLVNYLIVKEAGKREVYHIDRLKLLTNKEKPVPGEELDHGENLESVPMAREMKQRVDLYSEEDEDDVEQGCDWRAEEIVDSGTRMTVQREEGLKNEEPAMLPRRSQRIRRAPERYTPDPSSDDEDGSDGSREY